MKLIKKIVKNRIFIFVTTALIFCTIGVSAATYFPSNEVTYDNKESGLESTNVQGAIDELYGMCANDLSDETANNLIDTVVTSGDGLYKDEYEDRYFYKGENPNNFIKFANEELWRIVSVEADKTIKIIKNDSLPSQRFDGANLRNTGYCSGFSHGCNAWGKLVMFGSSKIGKVDSDSELNIYLNGQYYNNLDESIKDNIVVHSWNVGATENDTNGMSTNLINKIADEKGYTWYGRIGLMSLSELVRTNSDMSNCGTLYLLNKNASTCKNSTWIDNSSAFWFITPNNYGEVFYGGNGFDSQYPHNITISPRPSLYLSSSIKFVSGTGTKTDPFVIE